LNAFAEHIVACNGIKIKKLSKSPKYLELEHRDGCDNKNVNINLKNFVTDIYKLSDRCKDLLEIAGYIFAADRKTSRGSNKLVEYHSWSRSFHFHIYVRDYKFWNRKEIQTLLEQALCFMSGDHSYKFTFYQAGPDFPTNLFDNENFVIDTPNNLRVMLFSGGIDSLAGAVELLETTKAEVCLVSHQSGQWGVLKTQRIINEEIEILYPNRSKHFKFRCGLSYDDSKDESQRTRSFLYTSTAFAIAHTYKKNCIYLFENGITSINFAETQDLMNARASRTTHPQTIGKLQELFTAIAEEKFYIYNPYLFKTKTDVVEVIKHHKKLELLDSSVSCSRTRNHPPGFTHCGVCSQCIDRRFAVFAADVQKYDDNHLYHFDFLVDELETDEIKKALTEYIRLAQDFKKQSIDSWYRSRGKEIIEVEEYIQGEDEFERIDKLYNLCQRHSKHIERSIRKMRDIYDLPLSSSNPKSFFSSIIGQRVYQKDDNKNIAGSSDKTIKRKEIPSRGLKRITKETCEFLIKQKRITDVLIETKKNPVISKLIIGALKQENFVVTKQNETSISDYFRKYELYLKKDGNGKIIVINNNRAR